MSEPKDIAYWERNQIVAFLSKLYPSHLAKHPEHDKTWEKDWRTIVVINSPQGQLTWHIHDFDVPLFDHLIYKDYLYDGHTTEEKYKRLRQIWPELKSVEAEL